METEKKNTMAKMDLENNGIEMSREVELGVNLEDISLLRKKEAGAMKEEGLNIVLMRESQYEEIVVQDRTLDPTKHSTVIVANKIGDSMATSSNYLQPPATYYDVVTSRERFMDTLEKLHTSSGTKFWIPSIEGNEIDLHRLFVEVTARGGFQKARSKGRWNEVTAIFNIPTATNVSSVLQGYYASLLLHYELVYYFNACDLIPVSSDRFQNPSITHNPTQGTIQPSIEIHAARPVSTAGSLFNGIIDGKFDGGYFVTVTIGSEELQGVLYQPTECAAPQVSQEYGLFARNSDNAHASLGVQRRRRRKKSEIRRRDPAYPKRSKSAYNFFFAEQHAILKPLHPGQSREISRMIGERWNNLNKTEKMVYEEMAFEDKKKHRAAMELYWKGLGIVPLLQGLPEADVDTAEADMKLEETEGGDSPQTPDNASGSSTESDFGDDKTADKDLDMEE
ncbi:HMG (high mobility group) box with ARID/BRIGHT DNA-binding domain-like protein [Theobroma cacao]|uniref:HMG (High mobility group) box with ARID/BRIGHT DNA-binding domain-like protein n=1 Tax=Theobroma cacao TaxID=3641 RepID=A0A061ELL9_THECC|nr:HMG (high mobility group) box with ARID/BRIGHT DNA-binding domain-like protein [Theobroma cacao]